MGRIKLYADILFLINFAMDFLTLCLAGAAVLLVLGLIHWLFWVAMILLIAAAFLLKK